MLPDLQRNLNSCPSRKTRTSSPLQVLNFRGLVWTAGTVLPVLPIPEHVHPICFLGHLQCELHFSSPISSTTSQAFFEQGRLWLASDCCLRLRARAQASGFLGSLGSLGSLPERTRKAASSRIPLGSKATSRVVEGVC